MNDRFWAELWLVVVLLVITTGLLAHNGADLTVAGWFYRAGAWPVGGQFPWNLLYKMDRFPAISLALGGLVLAVRGIYKPQLRHWVRPGIFLVILLIVGPGIMVNSIFKEHWGRPRPRDVVQFNGSQQFLQPWQPGVSGPKGHSFPSGHSSAAFYMAAPFFIYRRRRKSVAHAWLLGGLLFGVLMSCARITQGGHFLTDTIWAWGMVHLTGLLLAALLLRDQDSGSDR